VLYAGNDAAAQSEMEKLLSGIRGCSGIGSAYQVRTDYDQVQMSNVYSFLPGNAAAPGNGGAHPAPVPLKMELSLKSGASSSAVLLRIIHGAPIPGGEAGFASATQHLLEEWRAAILGRIPFKAPKGGWAALYPGARFAGDGTWSGKDGPGAVYRYEWPAADGAAEGLQQSMVQALKKIPAIAASGSWYNTLVPGKSSIAGCRLLPPNPPVIIETSYEGTEQAGVVRLNIIAPEASGGRR
jgi:hypothetical protein